MKKIFGLLILLMFSTSAFAQADIEQGDSELGFFASYFSVDGFNSGYINLNYNYYITSHLKIGIGPTVMISSEDTKFSGSFAIGYNFFTSGSAIPYIDAYWYQQDFDPENGDFTDASFVNFGVGLKNFFNQYVALDSKIAYGLSLAENADSGILQITSGLSVFF